MEKLIKIQNELKAPKGQYNSFGKYKYRSCEDIIEAAKPICLKNKAVITLTDDLVLVGDRYYVKATATLFDIETKGVIASTTAFAREELDKKGMDGSQVTGTSSSYARKYALNGLLQIDDTKDADTDEHHIEKEEKAKKQVKKETLTPPTAAELDYKAAVQKYIESNGLDVRDFCIKHKLHGKSTNEDFRKVWEMVCKK